MSRKNLANQNSKVMRAFLGSSFVVFCLAVSVFVTTAYGENPAGDQGVSEVSELKADGAGTAYVTSSDQLDQAFTNPQVTTIVLDADIVLDTVPEHNKRGLFFAEKLNRSVTLDLNGHTLKLAFDGGLVSTASSGNGTEPVFVIMDSQQPKEEAPIDVTEQLGGSTLPKLASLNHTVNEGRNVFELTYYTTEMKPLQVVPEDKDYGKTLGSTKKHQFATSGCIIATGNISKTPRTLIEVSRGTTFKFESGLITSEIIGEEHSDLPLINAAGKVKLDGGYIAGVKNYGACVLVSGKTSLVNDEKSKVQPGRADAQFTMNNTVIAANSL